MSADGNNFLFLHRIAYFDHDIGRASIVAATDETLRKVTPEDLANQLGLPGHMLNSFRRSFNNALRTTDILKSCVTDAELKAMMERINHTNNGNRLN